LARGLSSESARPPSLSNDAPVELQSLISVKPDKLKSFSGELVKVFGGFRQRIAGLLDQSQHRNGRVHQYRKRVAQSYSWRQ